MMAMVMTMMMAATDKPTSFEHRASGNNLGQEPFFDLLFDAFICFFRFGFFGSFACIVFVRFFL